MAKKIKYSPKHTQPGLFDFTADLSADNGASLSFSNRPEPQLPPIDDFIINMPAAAAARDASASANPIADIEVDRSALRVHDDIVFISFGSGSSGNSSYIGDSEGGVLIDAGVDIDNVASAMKAHGLSLSHIKGVCLTHDHSDHVRFVYSLVRKHPHIGIYCTPKTLSGLLRRHSISRRVKDYHRPIYKEFAFRIGNFELTAFDVSHDGTDNAGYFITHGNHRFAIATDLGCITPRVEHYMSQARYIMLEANYDAEMLRNGPYPQYLKARIERDNGHLDNRVAGQFLARFAANMPSHIFLCHLSKDNNTPELALETIRRELAAAGITSIGDGSGTPQSRSCATQLVALPRFDPSPLFTLRD